MRISNTISLNKSFQYIAIYLLISLNGAVWFEFHYFFVTSLAIVLLYIFMYIKNSKYRDNNVVLLVVVLMGFSLLARFLNGGGIGAESVILWASQLLICVIAYRINRNEFFTRYLWVVVILATISILGWVASLMIPDIFIDYFTPTKVFTNEFHDNWNYGLWFFTYRAYQLPPRNSGFFSEPGRFQVMLNSSIFLVLFYGNKLKVSAKGIRISVFILVLALITSQSTTGYIALFVIMSVYILVNKSRGEKQIIVKQSHIIVAMIIVSILVLFDIFYLADSGMVNKVIISKFYDTINDRNMNSSGSARVLIAISSLKVITAYPLGAGFDNFYQNISLSGFSNAAGNGFFVNLAAVGIVPISLYLYWMFKPFFLGGMDTRRSRILIIFLVVFLYFNQSLAQTYLIYPSLIIFTIVQYDINRVFIS